jgi:hypothetical protein
MIAVASLLGACAVGSFADGAGEPTAASEHLAFDVGKIVQTDAEATIGTNAGGGAVIKVTTGHKGDLAGIELPAAGGAWDLSKRRFVVAEIGNRGTQPARVVLRLGSSGAVWGDSAKLASCVAEELSVEPGAGWTWAKVPVRRPAESVGIELFGMAEYPWGRPYATAKAGAGNGATDGWWRKAYPWGTPYEHGGGGVDPANVAKLVIAVRNPTSDGTLEIRNIRAAGAAPSADLLADPARFFPCLDELGQYRHAEWPGKTHSVADLAQRRRQEATDLDANPGSEEWDIYGGWKNGPTLKATGNFYVTKYEGKWWLVDPEGKLFFSTGITCVNPSAWEGWFRDGGETDETPTQERESWFAELPRLAADFPECVRKDVLCLKMSGHYSYGPVTTSFDFAQANNRRKYGSTWDSDFPRVTHRRLRSWGMNTVGIYSSPAFTCRNRTPYIQCFRSKSLPPVPSPDGTQPKPLPDPPRLDDGVFFDVFRSDFGVMGYMGPTASDMWLVGFVLDVQGRGDPALDMGSSGIAYALAVLRQPYDASMQACAKGTLVADLKQKYVDVGKLNDAWGTTHASWDALLTCQEEPKVDRAREDLAAFTEKAFNRYFAQVRETHRVILRKYLYFGALFEDAPAVAVAAAAKNCDVLTFRLNRSSPADFKIPAAAGDRPVFIAEFGFSALDRGLLAGNLPDQAARAAAYKQYLLDALKHPQIVGCHWAQFRDYPASGRTRDEANYNAGFVDIADTPYPEMVQAAREIGKTMYRTRLEAK